MLILSGGSIVSYEIIHVSKNGTSKHCGKIDNPPSTCRTTKKLILRTEVAVTLLYAVFSEVYSLKTQRFYWQLTSPDCFGLHEIGMNQNYPISLKISISLMVSMGIHGYFYGHQ